MNGEILARKLISQIEFSEQNNAENAEMDT